MDSFLEITAVICGLTYLLLLIKEKISCWIFGIISSALSIILFYRIQLYSESILYTYYVLIGFYGWWLWNKNGVQSKEFSISEYNWKTHLALITGSVALALGLGYLFKSYTDASNPILDAFTTVFSFLASYLQAKKILSSFLYWIIINLTTLFLYYSKEIEFYFFLTVVYLIFSAVGLIDWNKKYKLTSR